MKIVTQSLFIVLIFSGALSYTFPTPSLTTVLGILIHSVAGITFFILLLILFWSHPRPAKTAVNFFILLTTLSGIVLFITGASGSYNIVLLTHIAISVFCLLLIFFNVVLIKSKKKITAYSIVLTITIIAISSIWVLREQRWQQEFKISNQPILQKMQDNEQHNNQRYFSPSASQTQHRGLLPEQFFLESKLCEQCHQAIYQQWASSAHHFSSLNNPWYRKTLELLQQNGDTSRSRFCAGCHDPALLFTGNMNKPIKELQNLAIAQVGITCVTCHAIVSVDGSIGQGAYTLQYPDLHKLSTSKQPLIKTIRDFVINLNPEPHRRAFLKPFMRNQAAQFCSSCHKVHLDKAINDYRWLRGFNEYDSWQSSGISGQGAGAFYYPVKSKTCVNCHMPLVSVKNKNNRKPHVQSHRFAAANTALAFINQNKIQLATIKNFLQNEALTIDIFALSQVNTHSENTLIAPLDGIPAQVHAGDTINIDVVVRNKNIGHRFPGGTADAFDVWLELLVQDDNGVIIAESGKLNNNLLNKDVHQFRTLLVDGNGETINKRNSWQARALIYDSRISPGTANVIHYQYKIPQKRSNELIVQARLKYRKFSQLYSHYVFNDNNNHTMDKQKKLAVDISKLPIITLAKDQIKLQVLSPSTKLATPKITLQLSDWERWTDYGIGLLLQQNLKLAEHVFKYAIKIKPDSALSHVNLGRVHLKKRDANNAAKSFEQALKLDQNNYQAHLFYADILRLTGELQRALKHLQKVLIAYPNDRSVSFRIGRIYYLQDDYRKAINYFKQVLLIDPENVKAHYNLMLCYQLLQQKKSASLHQQRYIKFKKDDSSQTIAGRYRKHHPDDNHESQLIHVHELHRYSTPLKSGNMNVANHK